VTAGNEDAPSLH